MKFKALMLGMGLSFGISCAKSSKQTSEPHGVPSPKPAPLPSPEAKAPSNPTSNPQAEPNDLVPVPSPAMNIPSMKPNPETFEPKPEPANLLSRDEQKLVDLGQEAQSLDELLAQMDLAQLQEGYFAAYGGASSMDKARFIAATAHKAQGLAQRFDTFSLDITAGQTGYIRVSGRPLEAREETARELMIGLAKQDGDLSPQSLLRYIKRFRQDKVYEPEFVSLYNQGLSEARRHYHQSLSTKVLQLDALFLVSDAEGLIHLGEKSAKLADLALSSVLGMADVQKMRIAINEAMEHLVGQEELGADILRRLKEDLPNAGRICEQKLLSSAGLSQAGIYLDLGLKLSALVCDKDSGSLDLKLIPIELSAVIPKAHGESLEEYLGTLMKLPEFEGTNPETLGLYLNLGLRESRALRTAFRTLKTQTAFTEGQGVMSWSNTQQVHVRFFDSLKSFLTHEEFKLRPKLAGWTFGLRLFFSRMAELGYSGQQTAAFLTATLSAEEKASFHSDYEKTQKKIELEQGFCLIESSGVFVYSESP